jgi:hypothetical protein
MNIWRSGVFVCCFLGVLAYGLRLTNVQRTAILLLSLLGLRGMFLGCSLFLWLRIPVMGAGNSFCFVAHGGGDPGIENDKVGVFDIWVFE